MEKKNLETIRLRIHYYGIVRNIGFTLLLTFEAWEFDRALEKEDLWAI